MSLKRARPVTTALVILFIAAGAPAASGAASDAGRPDARLATSLADPVASLRDEAPLGRTDGPSEAASYDLGLLFGDQVLKNGLERDVVIDALVRGLRSALGGEPLSTGQRERAARLLRYGRERLAARNEEAARAFLARNAIAKGVQVLPSGLQYRVLVAGNVRARSPGPGDRVTVDYRASLIDQTELDSSYARGRPASIGLDGGNTGLREALLLMKPGAIWKVFVPPELAAGESLPQPVPPGSMLIYELELVSTDAQPPLATQP